MERKRIMRVPVEGEIVPPDQLDLSVEWLAREVREGRITGPQLRALLPRDMTLHDPDLSRAVFAALGAGIGSIYRAGGAAIGGGIGAAVYDFLRDLYWQHRNGR